MTQQARIRRLQDTLTIAGIGVIAFASWSLLKTTMLILLFDEEAQRQMFRIGDDTSLTLFYAVFAVLAALDLLVRLFVGLSARSEARGKRKDPVYLVFAALLAIASVFSIVLVIRDPSNSPSVFDLIMTLAFEATSVVTLVLMIFCAVRLRKLQRSEG